MGLSQADVNALIEELMDTWLGTSYHLLQRNCCDFSNEFCKRLGVGKVPGWVKSAAGMAAIMDDTIHARQVMAVVARGKVSRGATGDDGYKFGDLTRGVVSSVSDGAGSVLNRGYKSRAASEGDVATSGYKFGDVTRGV